MTSTQNTSSTPTWCSSNQPLRQGGTARNEQQQALLANSRVSVAAYTAFKTPGRNRIRRHRAPHQQGPCVCWTPEKQASAARECYAQDDKGCAHKTDKLGRAGTGHADQDWPSTEGSPQERSKANTREITNSSKQERNDNGCTVPVEAKPWGKLRGIQAFY